MNGRKRKKVRSVMVAAGKTETLTATEKVVEKNERIRMGGKEREIVAPTRTFPLFYRGETFLEFDCLVSRANF